MQGNRSPIPAEWKRMLELHEALLDQAEPLLDRESEDDELLDVIQTAHELISLNQGFVARALGAVA